ncbi:MAG TPA: Mrp/NBP35 family ATP-binding protein [Candidatus Aquilonibacter sp.]|nr:Mrp/NBP35 family ATP-binding protein [Candidatus Aquilonibacter sp.]
MSAQMPPHPGQTAPGPHPLPGVDAIIAVGSGKGGVGKTTLSVNLAVALAKMGRKVGLLDADVYGPNVPLMLGVNSQPRMIGENRIEPLEAFGIKVISVGFLNPGDKPIIWRGPMLHQIVRQFLGLVEWGHLDYMVVDLPPGTGDVALSLVQSVPLTGAVVVSTPSDVSLQDARKAIEMFRQMKVDLVGVVENMSFFTCPHCNHEIDIFSRGGAERMSHQFGVPFLGSIELDPEVRQAGDAGKPVVLAGENSAHAKSIYDVARKVQIRVEEIKASAPAGVIQIQ